MFKRNYTALLFGIFFVIGLITFLSYGDIYFRDSIWFGFFWKGIWLGLLPAILIYSYIRYLKK
jgi:hypothetical protein